MHEARSPRDVVITTMTTARDWMTLPQQPLDVVFVPSAMGHATSLGLGIALAQPDRRVIVCNGDGSMLMNLGSLVSIVAAGAPNLVVLVFENGVYEVTGAQPVPGAGVVDYAGMARAAGFTSVFDVDDLDVWRHDVQEILNAPGPAFACVHVAPLEGVAGPKSPGPARDRAARLIAALRT
ncbi:MAG TPA: thiamine pyrophosphate-dependent enzyme [Gemmatimonadaceae bacterium]|nr:thiamine pyrophosphate-dependent enzyme [Gemmatimonadaceae bacterium]